MRRRNRQSFTVPILEYGGGDGGAAEENKIELILFFIFVFLLCFALPFSLMEIEMRRGL